MMGLQQQNCLKDRGALEETDQRYLKAAIRLSASRIGRTAPNPSVGALIVRYDYPGGRVVGRGVTGDGGRPHGEVVALDRAGVLAKGACCYVSLEPCAHHAKTPPCVEALLRAGVTKIVIAMHDPDPRVAGRGSSYLMKRGVNVLDNLSCVSARRVNFGHITRVEEGRPAVTLKLALSTNGKIGRQGQGFIKITNDLSRRVAHGMRARCDTVLVGIGTILADNPDLTCRLPGMEAWSKPRLILDTNAQTPLNARVFDRIDQTPVHIVVGEEADEAKMVALEERGAGLIRMKSNGKTLVLENLLMQLAEEGMTNLLVEGGQQVAQAFLQANLVDRVCLFHGQNDLIGDDTIDAITHESDVRGHITAQGFMCIERNFYEGDCLETWERT